MKYLLILICIIKSDVCSLNLCIDNFCPPHWIYGDAGPRIDPPSARVVAREAGCTLRSSAAGFALVHGGRNCTVFPRNLSVNQPELRVKDTFIKTLKSGDFTRFSHVQKLVIEVNYGLRTIEGGAFAHLENVKNLSISFNENLQNLSRDSLDGLDNLFQLILVKNGFQQISDVSVALSTVSKLSILNLSENDFNQIKMKDFKSLSKTNLMELSLVSCQLEFIEPQSFCWLKKLKKLCLGENPLNSSTLVGVLEALKNSSIKLEHLDVSAVKLSSQSIRLLLDSLSSSSVCELVLSKNFFQTIDDEMFPFMPNLEYLDLSEVSALNVTSKAFVNLTNLHTLILSGNKLFTLPGSIDLKRVKILDLEKNSESYDNSYFAIGTQKFLNAKNLSWLNLSHNRMLTVHESSFADLENLEALNLAHGHIYCIAEHALKQLKNLIILNLSANFFVGNTTRTLNANLFYGLNNLRVLIMSKCQINVLHDTLFKFVPTLEYLILKSNGLTHLNGQDFVSLPHLKFLDLSKNSLRSWTERVFTKNSELTHLHCKRNKLSFLSREMLEDFTNISYLDLSDNAFTCDCTTYPTDWNGIADELVQKLEAATYCTFPDNTTLLSFLLDGRKVCIFRRYFMIIPLAIIMIFGLIVGGTLYYYRCHLKYWLFLLRLYLSRRRPQTKNAESPYVYDAFVSYSSDDRNFVVHLVGMLENAEPYLKLCVYERDFQIGTIITQNILESVAQSHRIILIVSNSYVKSQWCRWESQIAEHHRLFLDQDYNGLVLIKLGAIADQHLTPTLKYLLKTRVYLEWNDDEKKQKIFWEKLKRVLAPPKENTHL